MLTLTHLLEEAKCYDSVRRLRWVDGVIRCPKCGSEEVVKRGKDDAHPHRQRYRCKGCQRQFDDLTDTVFAGRHQPLRVWMGCLYLMGLNLSNQQIAQELGLNQSDVHQMTHQLRQAIVDNKPEVQLSGEVECDEVYVTAGHKGHPDAVKKRGVQGGGVSSKGFGAEVRWPQKSRRYSG
jgi:transposase-like protein